MDFKKAYDSARREVLHNILIEPGIPIKLVWLIKMCLNETYSRARAGKHLSDTFPVRNGLKQGDGLSPWLFSSPLEYAIRRVQVNPGQIKLNGTHQILVYADDVNILGGRVQTIKKNAEALVVASNENGLEVNTDKTKYMVNTDKTKYMVMSRDQNAGGSHNMNFDNSFFERVEEFKYLVTNLTNQNSTEEQIKSR